MRRPPRSTLLPYPPLFRSLFREGEPAEFWWGVLDGRGELLRRSGHEQSVVSVLDNPGRWAGGFRAWTDSVGYLPTGREITDRKSTRLYSSHTSISYAVFCF